MRSSFQLLSLCVLLASFTLGQGQFKTAGIKTRQPPSGNLQLSGNSSEFTQSGVGWSSYNQSNYNWNSQNQSSYGWSNQNYVGQGSSGFVPAETYQSSTLPPLFGHYVQPVNPPAHRVQVLDETALFINKTRSAMASGICFKEVPTASLLRNTGDKFVGNGTSPDMSRIEVCCEGYERNPHIYRRCEPICADDCRNGICTAPNTCVCIPGHVRNDEGKCISTCPLGCGNGICDDNNECKCREGYSLEPESRKYCQPQCNPGCSFGRCVAPNKCACLEGYRLAADGSCEPVCDSCENGRCTAPGHCNCNGGYLKLQGRCEPICSIPCRNGRCIGPDICECATGFEWDRKKYECLPKCDVPCLNGVCVGNNRCECKTGYVMDEHQRNICQPHCPQGCLNGFCSAPNFCICRPGFIKSGIKGRQTCQAV